MRSLHSYKQGDFTDLCAGPHLSSTGPVKAVKIQSVAGAYWRGNANRQNAAETVRYMLSLSQKELDEYLAMTRGSKEARPQKDRQGNGSCSRLTKRVPGFPFFLPKGMVIRNELEAFWRERAQQREVIEEIKTPLILNEASLAQTSGHWDHYKDNMYFTKIDGDDYADKADELPGLNARIQEKDVVIQRFSYKNGRTRSGAQT